MLPQAVQYVLERLEDAGFAAYAVGGCVRDTLLGRTPGDWDVTTAARPEQVLALFDGYAIPTGLKHGTVTVRAGEMPSGRMGPIRTIAGRIRCFSPTGWRRISAAVT